MPDYKKLDKVAKWIRKHPESHNQSDWAVKTECGTTCCFAGCTVLLEPGYKIDWRPYSHDGHTPERWDGAYSTLPSGGKVSTSDAAQEILDLNYAQANQLFDGGQKTIYELMALYDSWRLAEKTEET